MVGGGHKVDATLQGKPRELMDTHGMPTIVLPACIYHWLNVKVYNVAAYINA